MGIFVNIIRCVVDDIINCISYNVIFIVLFVKGVFYGIQEGRSSIYTRNPEK